MPFSMLDSIRVTDHSLFICRRIVLFLYVDDIIISGNDIIGISQVKSYLMQTFKMKDLSELTYFLGLEIKRTPFGIYVHQRKYDEDLLTTVGFSDDELLILQWNLMRSFARTTIVLSPMLPHIVAWLVA